MADEPKNGPGDSESLVDTIDPALVAAFTDTVDSFERLLNRWPDPNDRPVEVYHFTDCAGLIGILREKTLWASLSTALNDASEITYALQMFHDDLLSSGFKLKSLNPGLIGTLAWGQSSIFPPLRAFVCSFCGGAEAAHWLHYGRSGTGVALVFESSLLEELGRFRLSQVLYDPTDQRNLMRAVVDLVDSKASELKPEDRELMMLFQLLAASFVRLIAPRMKNAAFRSEDEYRLINAQSWATVGLKATEGQPLDTHFRSSNNRVVPYSKVTFPADALRGIELGAACPMAESEEALGLLMATFGKKVPVYRSRVAVRP